MKSNSQTHGKLILKKKLKFQISVFCLRMFSTLLIVKLIYKKYTGVHLGCSEKMGSISRLCRGHVTCIKS